MKRSDMILIMRTVLKFNHADDAYAFQRGEISLGALADRLMPSVLDRIEKEGMLPPKIKKESLAYVTNPETGERGEFRSWTYKSEWEPEDEAK